MSKTLKDLEKDINSITKEISKRILDPSKKSQLADKLVKIIRERVEAGIGVEEMGGQDKPFPGLRPSTIRIREGMKFLGHLSPNTTPETDNQTATGKMLESLTFEETPEGFNIYISDPSRQEVLEKQEDKRPWLFLNKKELEEIDELVDKAVDDSLSGLFGDS